MISSNLLQDIQLEDPRIVLIDLQWFAAEDEGRTEDPSEHKLRQAREEGRVAKSQELNGALVMLLGVVTLIILAPWLFERCLTVVRFYFERSIEADVTDPIMLRAFLYFLTTSILPIMITVLIGGIVGNIIQNRGFIFSLKPITPKPSKVIPKVGEYLQKTMFSFEGFFNTVKSIFKVIIVFTISFIIIRAELPTLLLIIQSNMWLGFVHVAVTTAKLLVTACIIFIAVSIPDYLVQRHQFMESMKMTKQEVKEEYKNLEGDPLVKSRLRQRMREMLSQNIPRAVAEADVVITNPTHFACVIVYDRATMQGPMLTAKGADSLAFRIREMATENNVPIIENKPLARAIFAEVEVGDIIPESYYKALAVILGRVYAMNTSKKKTRWL